MRYKAFMDFPLKVLPLYRKNNGNLVLFYQALAEINVNSSSNIILGDFDINSTEQDSQNSQLLSDYMQILSEPTQISGSLLNHVYIKKNF